LPHKILYISIYERTEGIVCVNETAKGKSTLVVEINDGYLIICPYQIEEQIG